MKAPLSIFRNWMYRIRCHDFGNGNIIDEGVKIIHPEYVSIGSNVVIHKDTIIHVAAKEKVRGKPIVKIGDRVHLSFRTWIAARAGIIIEEDVGFAPNVTLQDYIHGYEDINIPIKSQPLTGEAPIHIGKGCVLGANVIVLPGVTIGEQCMIGGNAVVARDISPYSVAVGNPAKVVRRFDRHRGEWVRV